MITPTYRRGAELSELGGDQGGGGVTMGQKRRQGGGRAPGKDRDSQLIFLLFLFLILSLSLCAVFSLTLSFIFLSLSHAHTQAHTHCHTHTLFPAGFWPLSRLLPAAWAPGPSLGSGSVAGSAPVSGSGPGTEAKQEPLSVGRRGQRARTQQEGPRLNLAERFGFQRLGMLNVLILNVFLFLFTGWYLLPSRVMKRHSVKSKEVMEECINPHRQ